MENSAKIISPLLGILKVNSKGISPKYVFYENDVDTLIRKLIIIRTHLRKIRIYWFLSFIVCAELNSTGACVFWALVNYVYQILISTHQVNWARER